MGMLRFRDSRTGQTTQCRRALRSKRSPLRIVSAAAADGFNVMPPALPSGLETFVEHVIPILRRRGLFRTEYSGRTLRDHYRIPRPDSQFAAAGRPASRPAPAPVPSP
jgi:hypothetical protein